MADVPLYLLIPLCLLDLCARRISVLVVPLYWKPPPCSQVSQVSSASSLEDSPSLRTLECHFKLLVCCRIAICKTIARTHSGRLVPASANKKLEVTSKFLLESILPY